MIVKLICSNETDIFKSKVIYRIEDMSFDVEQCYIQSIGSENVILINYIQIEVDGDGRLLYITGFCPLDFSSHTHLIVPPYSKRVVYAEFDPEIELTPGTALRLREAGEYAVYMDTVQGWVCIGERNTPFESQVSEFAPNSVIVIRNSEFVALWLKPELLSLHRVG